MSQTNEQFNQATYDFLNNELEKSAKRILVYEITPTTKTARYLPTDRVEREERIDGYKKSLISDYNNYVEYCSKTYSSITETSKANLTRKVAEYKLKFLRALVILDLKTDLPSGFEKIQIENVVHKNTVDQDESQIFFNQSHTSDLSGQSTSKEDTTPLNISNPEIGETTESFEKTFVEPTQQKTSEEVSNTGEPTRQITSEIMALSLEAILSGVIEFSSQSQPHITQFIANADMMIQLAPTQTDTVLTVIRTRLATASALGDISDKPWTEIKQAIRNKYIRSDIPFETAQERLLAIKQGPKEDIESYANRTKKLLEILNSSTINANQAVQAAQRSMNESLAIRKFKQNLFSEKIRLMAMNTDHANLMDAIGHAFQKNEELKASNVSSRRA